MSHRQRSLSADSEDSDSDERDLIDLCENLKNTYDVSLIDLMTPELKEAFKTNTTSLTDIARCSNGRPVLATLIHNYYTKLTKKPIAKFISGPKNLTVHWSLDYNKLIYVFGESHVTSTNCLSKFPGLQYSDIMSIEDYISHLYTNPYTYIDLVAEFPALKIGQYEYASDILSFRPFASQEFTLYKLFEKAKICVNPNTRSDPACRLGRVHFFDVRTHNSATGEAVDTMSQFFIDFFRGTFEDDQYIDRILMSWKKTLTHIKAFYKPVFDLENACSFFNVFIFQNKYNLKELETLIDAKDSENLGKNLREILEKFIRDEVKVCIRDSSKVVQDNIHILADYDNKTFNNVNKSLRTGVRDSLNIFKNFLTSVVAITADVYMLSRIFKEFKFSKLPFLGATPGDQPNQMHNIIIYAGDAHSQRCRRFLQSLDFEEVGKTGQSENNNDYDSCIDMKNIRQPFFENNCTHKNPNEHDYVYNYGHRYDFGNPLWDPMILG